MNNPNDQWLSELKGQIQKDPFFQRATETLRQLAAKGCDPMVIHGYAGRVAGYKSGNLGARMYGGPGAPKIARRIRAISGQLKKLAGQIEDLKRIRSFWSRMTEASCFHIPEELEEIAERLSRIRTKGFRDWNPQREAILDLLDHVRSSTGRYHYEEVSLLINAELVWRAMKRKQPPPEPRHDVDSLKMIIQRWKKERRAQSVKLRASKPDPDAQQNRSTDMPTPE